MLTMLQKILPPYQESEHIISLENQVSKVPTTQNGQDQWLTLK